MSAPIIHLSDFYKVSHRGQYPPDTEYIQSNMTSRSSRMEGVNHVIFFGLQYFIKEFLIRRFSDEFFSLHETHFDRMMKGYKRRLDNALQGDNDVSHWYELRDLGYLPIEIRALPEGAKVPLRVPYLTIKNTHPNFFWLGQWMETLISDTIWHPLTTSTIANEYRKLLDKYSNLTSDLHSFLSVQCHDFSMRGHSSDTSAAAGGAGHLLSFIGTDTIPAIDFLEEYYGADSDKEIVGVSCPATEHSVMTVNGEEGEFETIKRLITEVYPQGIISIVSDTYNLFRVLTDYLPKLKNEILNREGKVVIRPDCYDDETYILTNNGWKLFQYLCENDEIAQVLDDGTYEFIKPIKKICQYYKGDMIHFYDEKNKLDLLVTPNHRMVYEKNGKLDVQRANELIMGYWGKNFVRGAKAKNKGWKLQPIEKLYIAFQADGSYCTGTDKSIRFSFSKQRKIDRLKNILGEVGYEYKIYQLKDGRFEFNIQCDAKDFVKDFSWVYTNTLCSNWCQEFIEELSYWDATRRSTERFKFDTTNPSVIKIVELLALSAGYGVLLSRFEDTRKEIFRDIYTANILLDNRLGGQAIHKETVRYEGNVFCVQVPSGKVIVKRKRGVVVSGNSGDPVEIICGRRKPGFITTDCYNPSDDGVIRLLYNTFGGEVNSKGYKQLNDKVGVIYGDSITLDRAKAIVSRLKDNGFASTNIVLGIGSYTYQMVSRDTFGNAFKATAIKRNGIWTPMFKNPITDSGMKRSAKGLLMVKLSYIPCEDMCDDKNFHFGDYSLMEDVTEEMERSSWNMLRPVFRDGKLLIDHTLAEIRNRIRNK